MPDDRDDLDGHGDPGNTPVTSSDLDWSLSWPWVVGVIVMLLLAVGMVLWAYFDSSTPDTSAQTPPDASLSWDLFVTASRLQTFGEGRYLALQAFDDRGMPVVWVWDSEELDETGVDGHLLVAAEPSSARLWLVPVDEDSQQEWSGLYEYTDMSTPPYVYPHDAPPEQLVVWDLESEQGPTPNAPARWGKVEGPGEYDAYFEVDPLKGVYPSRLLFNDKGSHDEGHAARLPENVVTFEPRGWSPSGMYIAVQEMVQPMSSTDGVPHWPDLSVSERRAFIIEAETGKVVAQAKSVWSVSTPVFWHPTEDLLIWGTIDYDSQDPGPRFMVLKPHSQAEDVADALPGLVSSLESAESQGGLVYAGAGPEEVILVAEGGSSDRIYSLGSEGLMDLGSLPCDWWQDIVYSDPVGVAVLTDEFDDTTCGDEYVLTVYDKHGGQEQVLWHSSPDIAPPGGG